MPYNPLYSPTRKFQQDNPYDTSSALDRIGAGVSRNNNMADKILGYEGTGRAGAAIQKINYKPPVVAPIHVFKTVDVRSAQNEFDKWLIDISGGYINYERFMTVARSLPVLGNVLSLADALSDIILLIKSESAREDVFNWVDLSIDVLGVVPIPPGTAAARASLRPALATVRNVVRQGGKDVSEALVVVLADSLASHLTAEFADLVEKAEAKIDEFLKAVAAKVTQIMTNISTALTRLLIKGEVFDVGQNYYKAASVGSVRGTRARDRAYRPTQVESNGWTYIYDVVTDKAKRVANLAAKSVVGLMPDGFRTKLNGQIAILTSLGAMAANKITEVAAKHIKDFIRILIRAAQKKLGKKGTVPKNTVGKADGHVTPSTLEKRNSVTPAQGMAGCKNGAPTGSTCDINFAMGVERVFHEDFSIGHVLPIEWMRTYSSAYAQYDQSVMGARWTNAYMTRIAMIQNELVYFAEDGRQHTAPILKFGQAHHNPIEDFTITRLSDGLIALQRGLNQLETFEAAPHLKDAYRLTSIQIKNVGTVGLRYDHTINGHTVLSDIISKVGDEIDAHVRTQVDGQERIIALWQLKDGERHRQLSSYQYNSEGDLTLAQDENAHHWQYQYNQHLLTRYTDRTGRGMNIQYDGTSAEAKAIREWADDGSFDTQLQYIPESRLTLVVNALGDTTWHWYDDLGYTYRIIYPDHTEEWFFRNRAKDITKHIHPDGSTDHYVYDSRSNLIKHSRPDGSVVHFEYNDDNLLTGIADGEANIWRRDYDQRGNLTEEVDPLGHKTAYQYNKLNLPIIITDAKGGEKKLAYTDKGQLAAFTDCSGKTTTWSYDNRGRLVKQTNAAGETTAYAYSHEGRNAGQLESITHPDETVERFMHDAEGRLLTHTDPLDRQTNYRYSVAGLVAERIDAAGHELTYTYDKLGRLVRLDNENNRAYQFKYDPVGRLLEEVGFDGKATQYQYGQSSGVLERMTDGHTATVFAFDPMGRLNSRTMAAANETHTTILDKQTETFDYDGNGRLIMATNPNSKLQWFYDDAGNLEREHHEYRLNNYQHTAIWRHEYDPLGNRVKTIRPDGHTIELMTYGSGHVHGVLLDGRETLGFERDDLHREVLRSQANRLNQSQSYDPAGRLKEQLIAYDEALGKTSPFNQRQYQYDKSGQLTQISDGRRGGLSYRYDPIGRLLEASSSLGKELFAFDPAGNVQPVSPSTANEHPNQPARPSANEAPASPRQKAASILDNLMREYVGTHYEYDERGNMTKRTHNGLTTLFKWDAANRMTESLSREVHTRYYYDALGRRLAKHSEPVVQTNGSEGTAYVNQAKFALKQQHDTGFTLYGWDGDTLAWESRFDQYREVDHQTGQLGELVDNSRTTHFIYEPDSFVPMMQAVSQRPIQLLPTPNYQAMVSSSEGYDIDRDPVWRYQAENDVTAFDQIAFYQCDHLGTPQELTDMDGETAWSAEYKAWGEAKAAISKAAKRAGITNPIRFQGQYFDHETGLHYNRHRYYDPHSGRFVSRDPIGLEGGMNVFAYAVNPIMWVDTLGLNPRQPRKANGQYASIPKTAGGSGCKNCCDDLHRPYIRAAVRRAVEARTPKTADGRFIDINTRKPITGPYDLGHAPGHEFWREKRAAESKCMTQDKFNDYMNNSDFYRIEDQSSNRSHKFEDKSP